MATSGPERTSSSIADMGYTATTVCAPASTSPSKGASAQSGHGANHIARIEHLQDHDVSCGLVVHPAHLTCEHDESAIGDAAFREEDLALAAGVDDRLI